MKEKNIISVTCYQELNVVLHELISSMRDILGDNFVGAYLQGSFAVGDFDEHSDCDFIIVINKDISSQQLPGLQTMHKRIFNLAMEWAKHLEGSYFPKAVLRDYNLCGSELWYLDNGHSELIRDKHCNTVIVRQTLHEKGVVITGPEPSTLIEPIPVEILRRTILAVILDWGKEILAEPERFNNRFYQSFIALSYCRMLHDLHTGTVGSKRTGAEWAKRNLDSSWRGLIDRTWSGRPDPAVSIRQTADKADFNNTLAFVKYVMKAANKFAATSEL